MSSTRWILVGFGLALACGCGANEEVSAFVIGPLNVDRTYDVLGPTDDDVTTVRLRASKNATGFRVLEEAMSRGDRSPKKGLPLGRVEYDVRVDESTGTAVQQLAGAQRTLLKTPFAERAGKWSNATTIVTLGTPKVAEETCEISKVENITLRETTHRAVTTTCIVEINGNRLITRTEFAESIGMTKLVVDLEQETGSSRALLMTLREST